MTAGDAGGGFDELLAQMGMLQQHLSAAEQSVGRESVEGSAGGGAVVIRASGELSFDAVHIDPAVLDTDDVSVVEDLVLAAVRDAAVKLQTLRKEAMGAAVSGALGGLFGAIGELDEDEDEDDDVLDVEDVDDEEDEAPGPPTGPA